jgi:dephospho-CoA kinase
MGLIVGLTGGIGSGKSAAANLFGDLGAVVVDTDIIAHQLTGPGGLAMPALAAAFGPTMMASDGSLDRPAMRALAFADLAARKRLEAILHPLIREESTLRCQQALAGGAPYMMLAVPLLIESGEYRQRVDRVLVVDCEDEVRIARVAARSGLSRDEIQRIMATQCSRAARLTAADDIIDNTGTPDKLTPQVARLHREYLKLAARKEPGGDRKAQQ